MGAGPRDEGLSRTERGSKLRLATRGTGQLASDKVFGTAEEALEGLPQRRPLAAGPMCPDLCKSQTAVPRPGRLST